MALSGGQRGCLACIVLGSLALISGSVAPYWLSMSASKVDTSFGLWYYCHDDKCETYETWEDIKPEDSEWFLALHAVAGLATLSALIALFVSLGKLCSSNNDGSIKNAGIVAAVASVLGISATGIFFRNQTLSILNVKSDVDDKWSNSSIVFAVGAGLLAIFSVFALAQPNRGRGIGPV